jgi:hypothetical protein
MYLAQPLIILCLCGERTPLVQDKRVSCSGNVCISCRCRKSMVHSEETAFRAAIMIPSAEQSYSGLHRSCGRVRQASSPSPAVGPLPFVRWFTPLYHTLPTATRSSRPTEPLSVARLILRDGHSRPHIEAMHLDLTDEEAAALTQELHDIVENDRYPSR